MSILLSTAYAPPVQYLSKIYTSGGNILIEGCESFVKQTYRSRCLILTADGIQSLSIPIEQGSGHTSAIREVRLSKHNQWVRVHREALRTAYGMSPFFEYYWDDIEAVYTRMHTHLWELNMDLLETIASLIDLPLSPSITTSFLAPRAEYMGDIVDWRYGLRPKQPLIDLNFSPVEYYQPWQQTLGFIENLSAFDLLFNMGPESLLVLRDSIR